MREFDPRTLLRATATLLPWLLAAAAQARADEPNPRTVVPFRVEVVDDETGRGVPLVELRTVNQIRLVTDSSGIAAFDEPGLSGRKVFFHVKSHGYEYPKDGFGNRGVALDIKAGGSARIKIQRLNIAQRLYRVTGAGIYRDSVLTGISAPIREPLLNGEVLGQDSVVSALYGGKLFWFWGDTNRPGYPLGNFHVPGATSELPGKGGLDPAKGVNLAYFVGDDGFARPTCQMPGPGPTWITGLVVLRDGQGEERMFANYVKIRPPMETYERGLVEFDRQTRTFKKRAQFSMDLATYPGEHPGGHTFLRREGDTEYVYYCSPYPLVRVPADPDSLTRPDACEAFTCLAPGTRFEERKLDRGSNGGLRYGWKPRTQLVTQQQQAKLVEERRINPSETLLNLRDVLTGKTVLAHGGSVYWNGFKRRWVMIAVELFGSSMLGEVWYALADAPTGPWVYARKIVTHDDYSFYNPKQHPLFDQQNGRVVFFEGTYTSTFSGNKDPTPRYDYNQVMYQLDLEDPRLALPVAVYAVNITTSRVRLEPATAMSEDGAAREIAFFAPDRPGLASVPVRESREGNGDQRLIAAAGAASPKGAIEPDGPLFYVISPKADKPPPGTVLLYEFRQTSGPSRYYAVAADPRPGYERASEPIGRVWQNPGRASIP